MARCHGISDQVRQLTHAAVGARCRRFELGGGPVFVGAIAKCRHAVGFGHLIRVVDDFLGNSSHLGRHDVRIAVH